MYNQYIKLSLPSSARINLRTNLHSPANYLNPLVSKNKQFIVSARKEIVESLEIVDNWQ